MYKLVCSSAGYGFVFSPSGGSVSVWQECIDLLKNDLSQQQFSMWISPLQAEWIESDLILYAPNKFVLDWVSQKFLQQIRDTLHKLQGCVPSIRFEIGSKGSLSAVKNDSPVKPPVSSAGAVEAAKSAEPKRTVERSKNGVDFSYNNLNPDFTFDNFVVGKSNQLAKAAALQVAENSGKAYNPLCICGGVGLGKTHTMHAVGNFILQRKPNAKVVYLHSERFVADMVKALQNNTIDAFKMHYRSVDALLIDDIQFFAGKERSQEEFFHTFNALLEAQQQVIFTCDRYPKEINGLEERLKSRFGSGLTVVVEPPELETRVAILMNKAEQSNIELPPEVAFFIAKRIRSNVRELEGALKRVMANAQFTGQKITMTFVQEALKDLLALHDRIISIDNILTTVSEYYNIKISDLKSKRRSRSVARPRQVAMTLAKELTNHSLPEIGEAFGGRDHTTVLHAIKTIKSLRDSDLGLAEDFNNLLRVLSA